MRFFKVFALLLSVFFLTVSGKAMAAQADVQAFQNAYLQSMADAKGYHFELLFQGPTFQSNVIADGQLWKDGSAVAEGKLSWGYTDLATGQSQQKDMPFYAERTGPVVTFYGQRNGKWQKENIMESFSWLLDAVGSEDRDTKLKYAATVKNVQTEDLGNGQVRMQVTFDGKALAGVKDKAIRDRIATMSGQDQQDALASVNYLNTALSQCDPTCTWTIKKDTGKTAILTADLTEVMRNYAKAVLQDSYDSKISLTKEETDFLAAIGYYYNLQFYLVRNDDNAKQVVIPAAVKNGTQDSNIFAEEESEVVTALKK